MSFLSHSSRNHGQNYQNHSKSVPIDISHIVGYCLTNKIVKDATKMKPNKNTAEIIRNARLEAKLSRQQMANKYDISLRTLESWEDGERTPPDYVLKLLLRCLKAD